MSGRTANVLTANVLTADVLTADVLTADVLIIGAGAYGLSAAWWMARRREGRRILVLDALDFAAGGTGRVGGGFRMQWGLDFNILLSQESIAFFEDADVKAWRPAPERKTTHGEQSVIPHFGRPRTYQTVEENSYIRVGAKMEQNVLQGKRAELEDSKPACRAVRNLAAASSRK